MFQDFELFDFSYGAFDFQLIRCGESHWAVNARRKGFNDEPTPLKHGDFAPPSKPYCCGDRGLGSRMG
jgi:hypothetical protein